jgi:hypothetical protein
MLWVSVHVPKTAGTSFWIALERHFGVGRLLMDDVDRPMNVRPWRRKAEALWNSFTGFLRRVPNVDCIHGHFMPFKYLGLARKTPVRFVTWMRHPIDRLVSTYHFMHRRYPRYVNARRAGMNRRVVEEKWPLEKFLLHPYYRDTYSKFFWRFPLERFDFIGITEFFFDDLEYFARKFLACSLPPLKENVNPQGGGPYLQDSPLRRQAEEFHAVDMELYRRALELRQMRLGSLVPIG